MGPGAVPAPEAGRGRCGEAKGVSPLPGTPARLSERRQRATAQRGGTWREGPRGRVTPRPAGDGGGPEERGHSADVQAEEVRAAGVCA